MSRIRHSSWGEWLFAAVVWVFALEYATYLVRSGLADKLIKLAMFAGMLLLAFSWRSLFEFRERRLLFIFMVMFAAVGLPSVIGMDGIGMIQWMKFALMATVLVLVLMREAQAEGQASLILLLCLPVGVFFSLQAISAFVLILFQAFDLNTYVEIGRRSGQFARDLGLFGYANALQHPTYGVWVLRVQSWFVEPSIFAAFLVLPAFASYGIYRDTKRWVFLVFAIMMFSAIFVTFSLAGYFAILSTGLFLLLSRLLYRLFKGFRFGVFIYPCIILAVFGVCAKGILNAGVIMNEINLAAVHAIKKQHMEKQPEEQVLRPPPKLPEEQAVKLPEEQAVKPPEEQAGLKVTASITKMFARDPRGTSGNMFREGYALKYYLSTLAAHPFGIGLGHTLGTHSVNSANALFFWLISGGIVALCALVLFFWHIFKHYCHPLLNSRFHLHRCLAASFIGHSIHNLSYGNWLAPFFLIHLAIVVAFSWQMARDEQA